MSAKEILKGLDGWHYGVPEKLLQAAVENKAEVTPGLIAALEEVSANPVLFLEEPGRNLYYWAAYLLAHFEEKRALSAVIQLFRIDRDFEELVLDIAVEDGAMLLANVAGGDFAPILHLLHDRTAPSPAREAAADALGLLCVWNEIEPARVQEELRRAFETLRDSDIILAAVLVNAAIELDLRELAPEITKAFDRRLVDLEDFEFAGEWLHDPDFETPPPYIHVTQSIDDIVEFFMEKAGQGLEAED